MVGLILGSGFGGVLRDFRVRKRASFVSLGLPRTTVPGHTGELVEGNFARSGIRAVVIRGRYHLYEDHGMKTILVPVKLAREAGASRLIITNAAGGVSRRMKMGDAMLISDQINLTGSNPLAGRNVRGRFLDPGDIYSRRLHPAIMRGLKPSGRRMVRPGVLAGVLGPSYETPAEAEMLRRIGADAVTMSTVNEAIYAAWLGIKVIGVSFITNSHVSGHGANHDSVVRSVEDGAGLLGDVIESAAEVLEND